MLRLPATQPDPVSPGGESVNNHQVELVIKVSKGTADFLDLLAELNGTTRDELLSRELEGDILSALDSPLAFWNREHLAEKYSLK
jgi:hypothetical protein